MVLRRMVNTVEFYSKIGKIGSEKRWKREHSKVRINQKMSKEKVAIISYLSGDGHIKARQDVNKQIHYGIELFPDNIKVANRIINLFKKEFNIIPRIRNQGKHFRVELKNKPACLYLLSIGKYGGKTWEIPKELNKSQAIEWIKCFFDCEAYVNTFSRVIQVKSINHKGLQGINKKLRELSVNSKVYGPYKQKSEKQNDYSMLVISGLNNLLNYKRLMGFYHPNKKEKLNQILQKAGIA